MIDREAALRIALAALVKAVENAESHLESGDGLDIPRALAAARWALTLAPPKGDDS